MVSIVIWIIVVLMTIVILSPAIQYMLDNADDVNNILGGIGGSISIDTPPSTSVDRDAGLDGDIGGEAYEDDGDDGVVADYGVGFSVEVVVIPGNSSDTNSTETDDGAT